MGEAGKRKSDRLYYQRNRERILAMRKARYWADAGKARQESAKYRRGHVAEYNEYRRRWRVANPDKVHAQSVRQRERDPQKYQERLRRLEEWHKPRAALLCARRRARLRGLPDTLTLEQWNEIKESFGHRCAYCGEAGPLEQEHVTPLSKGGGTTNDNIVPACRSCNSKKGANLVEWRR